MATIRPFAALRPPKHLAPTVSCLPYDVMNHKEACDMAVGCPASFLHICRADIDTSEAEIHEEVTYKRSYENLLRFLRNGFLERDASPRYYIYRQVMWGRTQTGIVGCASVDEYLNNTIRKHELTRKEKEKDRICHFDTCSAQTEPVFLAYRKHEGISAAINEWIANHEPEYDFVSDDGIAHILWVVADKDVIDVIRRGFEEVSTLYIADGHHRTASAAAVSAMRRAAHPNYTGNEEFNYLMAVTFCDEELFIMDYNRVVADLNGLSKQQFIDKVSEKFDVRPTEWDGPYSPAAKHEFGMCVQGDWFIISAKPGTYDENHPIESLDCSILQNNVLAPILGIDDPRTSPRIDFVGGIRGLQELENRARNGGVAFSLFPVTMQDLFRVADSGEIMPPKSTWFEPKLRSGLFVHEIER